MANSEVKREARKRRILENLDNRLEKITGKFKENLTEEKFSNLNYSVLEVENSSFVTENISTIRNKAILREKQTDFLQQDNDFEVQKIFQSNVQFQQPNDQYIFDHSNYQCSFQENRKTCDNINYKSIINSFNQIIYEQSHYLFSFFCRPLSYIFLAAFVNILFISNVDFSLYKGIITPYIIMSITHWCLGNKLKEFQDSSILVATLILCNIKPEIVYKLKKVLTLCKITIKDFALYLTSFILFNWIAYICYTDLNHIKFF